MINSSNRGSAAANGVQSTNRTNANVGFTVKMSIKMYYLNAYKHIAQTPNRIVVLPKGAKKCN